jgi:hypothetical protein
LTGGHRAAKRRARLQRCRFQHLDNGERIDTVPSVLNQALDAARDVPIDVDPIFSFDETVR